nr:unnamed protein product [Callosobruchus chinensis]
MDEAKEIIDKLLTTEKAPDLDFGGIYKATIVELRDIGVMVTLYPGMPPALCSSFCIGFGSWSRDSSEVFGRDPVSGLMRLSRKVLQAMPR